VGTAIGVHERAGQTDLLRGGSTGAQAGLPGRRRADFGGVVQHIHDQQVATRPDQDQLALGRQHDAAQGPLATLLQSFGHHSVRMIVSGKITV
jgi:hypothetical protein